MKKSIFKTLLCICLSFAVIFVSACGNDSDSKKDKPYFTVEVIGGTGGGNYYEGINCKVSATVVEGKQFMYWLKADTKVSSNAEFVFTVKEDTTLVAVYGDAVADIDKAVFKVEIPKAKNADKLIEVELAAWGAGGYFEGSNCTVKLKKIDMQRKFLGWVIMNSDETLSDIVSAEKEYTFTVTKDIKLIPVFNTGIIQLKKPGTKTIHFGSPYVEFDRNGDTVFVANVSHVLFNVYDNAEASGEPVGSFTVQAKKEPTTNPSFPNFSKLEYFEAYVRYADQSLAFLAIGSKGNYYLNDIDLNHQTEIFRNIITTFDMDTKYYFTAQLIGVEGIVIIDGKDYEILPSEVSNVCSTYYRGNGYAGQK